jgi:hypothetical protein
LLDECIDRRLAAELVWHEVKTVPQMGWAAKKNGELLKFAEVEFDVFLTVDSNLAFQQNLSQFNIAVLVLRAASNRLADLRPPVPRILSTLPTLVKGKAETISI